MSKCWYCGKEIKNENDKEHIGICDKCYQESFKVGNTVLTKLIKYKTDKDQKIADLEAKLAESEEYNKMLLEEKGGYIDLVSGYSKKCKNYEQQLAERTAEANARYDAWQEEIRECDRLRLALAEKEKELFAKKVSFNALANSAKKYQIIFTVEQLEKVKEILLENLYDLYSKPSEIWDKYGDLYDVVVEGAVNGTIDNLIKQLKEKK